MEQTGYERIQNKMSLLWVEQKGVCGIDSIITNIKYKLLLI